MSIKIIQRVSLCAIASVVVLLCSGCAVCHYYGQFNGRVFESPNGKPIQGAAVVGVYRMQYGTVGGAVDRSIDAAETTTDLEGRFVLPGKLTFGYCLPFSWFLKRPDIHILAPGYMPARFWSAEGSTQADRTNAPCYEFRVSRAQTWSGYLRSQATFEGPASEFPNYLRLLNEECRKHGLSEWHGWQK